MINKIKIWWNDSRIRKDIFLEDNYSIKFWNILWIVPTTLALNLLIALISLDNNNLSLLKYSLLIVVLLLFSIGALRMHALNIILGEFPQDETIKECIEMHNKKNNTDLRKRAREIFGTGIVLPSVLLIGIIIFKIAYT